MPSVVAPAVAGHATISDDAARQLWNWQLRRQGLSPQTRLESAAAVANAALGLHAARLPSPFATVAARAAMPEVALSLLSAAGRSGLMTVRCMRKTLHVLPVALAAAAHGATVHFRERDALRAIVNAGADLGAIARATDAIHRLLNREGPLFHREIETRLAGPRTTVTLIRLAMKLAWERGTFTYVNNTTGWNREHRTFAITSDLHPDFHPSPDRSAATSMLVATYFDRYGPATVRDATWWSGLSRESVVAAMAASQRPFIAVATPWCDEPAYLYLDHHEAFLRAGEDQRRTGVNLLAHEDVALKAFFQSRRRYLDRLPARRAFNQIGEALPTVMVDGTIVGTWAWDTRTRTVTWAIERGHGTPTLRRDVKSAGASLTEILRAGWTPANPSR